MEIWIGFGGIIIAFSALWWKMTTSLVTKDDLKEMRRQIDDRFGRIENDIRELRQALDDTSYRATPHKVRRMISVSGQLRGVSLPTSFGEPSSCSLRHRQFLSI